MNALTILSNAVTREKAKGMRASRLTVAYDIDKPLELQYFNRAWAHLERIKVALAVKVGEGNTSLVEIWRKRAD